VLTVILSSFNELNNPVFWRNLELLSSESDIEILIIDGGSDDGTLEKLGSRPCEIRPGSQRGERYNVGLDKATGDLILLVHPRTLLSKEGLEDLRRLSRHQEPGWGAFRHSFDSSHPILRFTSWYSNHVRGRRGIFYLDHCLYLSADLARRVRFPSTAIFEDTVFCRELRKHCAPILLPRKVITSAVRFRKNGVYRQSLMNQVLKILFFLGVPESAMNRLYEKGLSLNSKK
jgi:glycosyltransferase involved in cell wall biosynthesis